jgi:hypothetical protein
VIPSAPKSAYFVSSDVYVYACKEQSPEFIYITLLTPPSVLSLPIISSRISHPPIVPFVAFISPEITAPTAVSLPASVTEKLLLELCILLLAI